MRRCRGLDAKQTARDMVWGPDLAATVPPDGAITLRLPSTIGEPSVGPLRVRGDLADNASGHLTLRDIDLSRSTATPTPVRCAARPIAGDPWLPLVAARSAHTLSARCSAAAQTVRDPHGPGRWRPPGRRAAHFICTTTLPFARPCARYASASRACANGKTRSMTGRTCPDWMSWPISDSCAPSGRTKRNE